MPIPERNVAVGVGVGVGAVLAGWWAWKRMSKPPFPHTWEEVGEVSELTIYPLKSARGIQKSCADATIYGLKVNHLEDRSFMVINNESNFVSIRQVDTLAAVETDWRDQTLTLRYPGMEDVSVNIERDLKDQPVLEIKMRELKLPGVYCGDKVSEWLSQVLYKGETKVMLVYKADLVKNRPARVPEGHTFTQRKAMDRVTYADNSSFHLACQSSLDDLNTRLDQPITMGNFRPNIVVKGSKAYDEDDWIYVKIGKVVLRRLKPCERCVLVTVDPRTGIRSDKQEPISTLKQYQLLTDPPQLAKLWKAKPIFGITMAIDSTGQISVGDKVSIARASVHPHLRGY